jgi:site-specific DNA-methyltransferase (adenine-specific)
MIKQPPPPTIMPSIIKIDPKCANAVAQMTPVEFGQLKQDIDKRGLELSIVLNDEGVCLDGHHRIKALKELGKPIPQDKIETRHFDDPLEELEFVVIINAIRRHHTPYQRFETGLVIKQIEMEKAARRQKASKKIEVPEMHTVNIGTGIGTLVPNDTKGKASDIAAKKVGLSPATFTRCEKIHNNASEEIKQKLRENRRKINAEYKAIQKKEKKQKLLADASTNTAKLPHGIRLIQADFTKIGEEVPSGSVPCIFTDPPYEEKDLPKYDELGKLATRVLQPGGSLVTYLGEGYADIVIEKLKASGLKFWTILTIELKGNHTNVHFRKVFAYCKTLLWFVKGDKLREGIPPSYIPNFVVSSLPEKLLHTKGWGQSPIEAEHVIKYLTFPGEIVLDPMMGEGTTGIAAINRGRQFIGIEIDEDEYKQAALNIRKHSREHPEGEEA